MRRPSEKVINEKIKCFLLFGGKSFIITLIFLNFGARVVTGNKDIPICHKQWKELGKDMAEWRDRCLDDDREINSPSCHAEKEYFEERRLSHKQMCFYEGPFPEPYLLVNSKTKIAVVDLTSEYSTSVISKKNMITYLTVDPAVGKMMLETKARIWKIERGNFDGSKTQIVYQDAVKGIQTFSVDWIGRRTFWVNSKRKNEIFMGTTEFKCEKRILRTKGNIYSLAVDPNVGYLFCDNQHKMIRISFSGTDKKEFNTSLDGFRISLDYFNKLVYLYGSGVYSSIIQSMDYDGRHTKTIIESSARINAFVTFGDILYLQNSTSRVILGINVTTGLLQHEIFLPKQWSRLADIVVVDKSKYPTDGCPSSPCRANEYCSRINNNSTCKSHFGFHWDGSSCKVPGKSCACIYKSGERKNGIHTIDPDGLGSFQVWCDMETDGGGWTVFQRRQDASVDFYRGWSNYTAGFGDLNGNFWLGLDKIHRLTNSGQNVLRVDLMDFDNTTAYAQYGTFSVASESERYRLDIGNFSGNAGDSLSYHNGMMFTTRDTDNDGSFFDENCAVSSKGGWWYNDCHLSNLNGLYLKKGDEGIVWYHWKRDWRRSMKKADMKLRSVEH